MAIDIYQNGQTNHITSDKAVYEYHVEGNVTNMTATFTGNPRVENAQTIITGDSIVWDSVSGRFTVTDQKMIFKQGLASLNSATAPI